MSEAGDALIRSLVERPGDWRQTKFCIEHLPSGQKYWTRSGMLFYFRPYPELGVSPFTFWDRLRISRAVRAWATTTTAATLAGPAHGKYGEYC